MLRVGDLGSLTLVVCQIRLLWWFKITFEHSSMALPTRWSLKSPLLEHGPYSSRELNEAEVTVTSEARFHMASVWLFLSLLLSTGVGSFELPWKKVGCPEAAILESDPRGGIPGVPYPHPPPDAGVFPARAPDLQVRKPSDDSSPSNCPTAHKGTRTAELSPGKPEGPQENKSSNAIAFSHYVSG